LAAFGGTILLAASTARLIAGSRAAWIAAGFVATSVTFGLQPAATVRPYALVTMFAALTLWAAVRESLFLSFLAHVLGLFTHPIFVFFSLSSAAAGGVLGERRTLLIGAPLAAIAVYAGAWGTVFTRTAALPATSWMPRPMAIDAVRGLLFWGDHATPILAAVLLGLLAVRGRRSVREHASWIAWLGLLIVLVLAGTLAVSMVRPVYLASRTPVLILPAAAVALGVVLADLAPALVACAVLALVAVSAVRYAARSAARPDPYPTRASLGAVAPRMRCGDVIIAAGLSYAPLLYYASMAGVPSCVTIRPFPDDVGDHPGWLDPSSSRQSAFAQDAERLASSVGQNGTVWTFVARRGVGTDAGTALIAAISRTRLVRESVAAPGSFFDEVVAFSQTSPRQARP
jgi:hypothetical protein